MWRDAALNAGASITDDSLGRLFLGSVGVKLAELCLDALQWVLELSLIENGDSLFDPLEQVRSEALILIDHSLVLQYIVQNLWADSAQFRFQRIFQIKSAVPAGKD